MTAKICSRVIFDLDGVLVHSAPVVERTWRRWARRHELDERRVLEIAHGRRSGETVQAIAPELNVDEEVRRILEWELSDRSDLTPISGAQAVLNAIAATHYAVVTSGSRALAQMRLAHVGLAVPSVFVTADDVSRGKPDPEGYLLAAARMGVQPEQCLVFEDSPPGIAAGKSAGMPVVAVATTHPADALSQADAVGRDLRDVKLTSRRDGTYRVDVFPPFVKL